jgi:hypothetical protein
MMNAAATYDRLADTTAERHAEQSKEDADEKEAHSMDLSE